MHASVINRATPSECAGWQWRNFFIPICASCSGRHDVGQENVNILQHLQSDRWSGASTELFLNLLIQFHLISVTNLHQSQVNFAQYDMMRYNFMTMNNNNVRKCTRMHHFQQKYSQQASGTPSLFCSIYFSPVDLIHPNPPRIYATLCTLAASRADPWPVSNVEYALRALLRSVKMTRSVNAIKTDGTDKRTERRTDGQTDGRTQDRYIMLIARHGRRNNVAIQRTTDFNITSRHLHKNL